MAQSVNEVRILGNLGADPEVRNTAGGSRVAKLSVATSTSWKDQQGQWQEKTEWHRVVAWQNQTGPRRADLAEKLRKGDKVYVAGQMTYGSYVDREGVTRYTAEIKADQLIALVDLRQRAAAPSTTRDAGPSGPPTRDSYDQVPEALSAEDDELPF